MAKFSKQQLDRIVIDFTIAEIENLLMMHSQVERYYRHEAAVSAVRKIQKARGIYIARFGVDALPQNDAQTDAQSDAKTTEFLHFEN